MVPDLDIWRVAHLLVKQHGPGAAAFAERRAEELLASGEAAGYATFLRIARAVEELQRERPAESDRVH